MIRVIRPEYDPRKRHITERDYVEVPRLSTFGTFNLMDMLSNVSIENTITTYTALKANQPVSARQASRKLKAAR